MLASCLSDKPLRIRRIHCVLAREQPAPRVCLARNFNQGYRWMLSKRSPCGRQNHSEHGNLPLKMLLPARTKSARTPADAQSVH